MTSLLGTRPSDPALAGAAADDPTGRPALLAGVLAGLAAAGAMLLVCLAVGVTGWYLSDAGIHGQPRDGMRVGALAWLTAHGSGVEVRGTLVTVVPLGLTALCAWVTWRFALRLGEALWSHGPDADRISDGERDWTVPSGWSGFALGYLTVVAVTLRLAAVPSGPGSTGAVSAGRTTVGVLLLLVAVALPAVASGSGRAAVHAARWPVVVRHAVATARTVLRVVLGAAAALVVGALVLDLAEAANMLSRVGTDSGETALLLVVSALFAPNAMLLGSAWLLGPGFAVGAGTLVSPGAVTLGPLPVFPLLAALPEQTTGTGPGWSAGVLAVPAVGAAYAVVRTQLRRPTLDWHDGLLRGCGGGLLAGAVLTLLVTLAGGAAGPGRMQQVGAVPLDVLVHATTSLGLGGLVGGALITWWQRRTSVPVTASDGPARTPSGDA